MKIEGNFTQQVTRPQDFAAEGFDLILSSSGPLQEVCFVLGFNKKDKEWILSLTSYFKRHINE